MASNEWRWWKQEKWINVYTAPPEAIDPDKYIVCSYYVEPGEAIEGSAQAAGMEIAAEESIGTWTTVKTAEPLRYAGKVFKVEAQGDGHIVQIAFPLELFDVEAGLSHLLSDVSGNLYGLSAIKNVRFLDFHPPKAYLKEFKGPKFGIEGVREIVGTKADRRPHLGTIIKPKVGLSPKETAEVAYEAAVGGVDFIKDDETLTSQKFCPLLDRLTSVMEKLDKAKEETGRTVMYALNITSDLNRLFDYADKAIANGANCLMVDFLCVGLPALRALAEDPSVKVPIHVHRCMHAAMTRNPKHGIHMMVLAKLVRLAGGDQLHTGTAAGKMEKPGGKAAEVRRVNDFLREEWNHVKPTMPVASGGVHPALVPYNLERLGRDIVVNAGGGIHGHPWGTRAGAKAMRAAFDAALKGVSLEEYAKRVPELKAALDYWGSQFLPPK